MVFKVGDINKYPITFYKKRFGVLGEELWMHANGIDISNIKEQNVSSKNKSYGMSQILFKDYSILNIEIIIREMASKISKRLRINKKVTSLIGFGIGYSRSIGGGFYHSRKLDSPTNDENVIFENCIYIFNNYIEDLPIRKVSISLGKIENDNYKQLNLFEEAEKVDENNKVNDVIDDIARKFGDNSILKASSLLSDSTIKMRNGLRGGHKK